MDAATLAIATLNAHRAAEQQRELRILAAQRERRSRTTAAADGRAPSEVTTAADAPSAAAFGLAGPAR
ncbi:hypothetical protein [Microbacterium yannicii]|uniref:hypothetical protein n=1 Tax=Microbacterium yannicii TaxID=671622 RepID=UPI00030E1092|nr:hypothetical protein [Microbacterium yannicii]